MRPEEAWQSAVGEIEVNVGRGNYTTWMKSARLVTYEDGQFVVGVPNGYVKEWMENRLAGQLKKILGDRMGRGVDVAFTVYTPGSASANATQIGMIAEMVMPQPDARPRREDAATSMAPVAVSPRVNMIQADGLNPRYTFESFVVGSGNRM